MIFPASHDLIRLKWAFASTKNGAWGDEPDGVNDVICIRAADFDSDLGRMTDTPRTLRSIDAETFRKVSLRSGDLIVEKSGGGEKQLVGRAVVYEGSAPAVCSNFLARCRPSSLAYPKFLNYLMLAIYSGRGTYPHIKQTTGIQNLDLSSFLNIEVKLPTISIQERIAAFLNEKTTQIDALIEKKQGLLERLAEKRQAIITQAVTKGLNPSALMKDSGIDWLGQIPAHWEVRGLTKCTTRIDYRGATPEKSTFGVFLVTARNIKGGCIDYSLSEEFVREENYDYVMRRGKPVVGEVLLTTEAPLGEIAYIDRPDVALAQRVIKFSSSIPALHNSYLGLWFQCDHFQFDLKSRATGSTALGIKASKIVELRCLLPPLDEQHGIFSFVQNHAREISEVRKQIEASLKALFEYRSAVITAAVTGQAQELL